jgi:hypothetical protein
MDRVDEAYRHLAAVYRPAIAHYNLGHMLHQRGSHPTAVKHLNRALEIDPSLASARDLLAVIGGPKRNARTEPVEPIARRPRHSPAPSRPPPTPRAHQPNPSSRSDHRDFVPAPRSGPPLARQARANPHSYSGPPLARQARANPHSYSGPPLNRQARANPHSYSGPPPDRQARANPRPNPGHPRGARTYPRVKWSDSPIQFHDAPASAPYRSPPPQSEDSGAQPPLPEVRDRRAW